MKIVSSSDTKSLITAGEALYILFIGLLLLELLNRYFNWNDVLSYYFGALAIGILVLLVILNFHYSGKYRSFSGKIVGDLIFKNDGILVNEDFIELNTIKKIEIKCDDYLGKDLGIGKKLLTSPNLSMGINNYLIIHLSNTNIQREVYFQVESASEMEKYTSVFHNYIEKGKLDKSFILPHLLRSSSN